MILYQDQIVSGSINVTGGVTGSLLGTASFADQATTSSYYDDSHLATKDELNTFTSSYNTDSSSFSASIHDNSASILETSASLYDFTQTYNSGSWSGSLQTTGIVGTGSIELSGSIVVMGNVSASNFYASDAVIGNISGSITNALTSSYVDGLIQDLTLSGSLTQEGSTIISGTLEVTQGITGSLYGTSSYADFSLSSSFASSSDSASYASSSTSASYASASTSASFASSSDSASYALVATSASFASSSVSASYSLISEGFTSGSKIINGDLFVSGILSTREFYVDSSSVIYTSGSTKFGNSLDDIHEITGSVTITGSMVISSSLEAERAVLNNLTGSLHGTASYALTASYLEGNVDVFPYTGSATISGSLDVTGSVNVSGSITGSLLGTASYALTASYLEGEVKSALTSSYVDNLVQNVTITGSLTVSGSTGMSGSLRVTNGITGSLLGTASYALDLSSSVYVREVHVSNESGNDNNRGTLLKPLKTIERALTTVTSGQQIIIHPGTYSPTASLSFPVNANNISIVAANNEIGGLVNISGSFNMNQNIGSVRIVGLTMQGITISGSSNVYLKDSTFINSGIIKTGSGYLEIDRVSCEFPVPLTINGGGTVVVTNSKLGVVTVNNPSATVNLKDNTLIVTPNAQKGTMLIDGGVVYSLTNTTGAVFSSPNAVVALKDIQCLTPSATPARLSLSTGSFYSTQNIVYDKTNSVLGNSLNTTSQFQTVNADIISGSVARIPSITGSLWGTASFATNALSASRAATASWLPISAGDGITINQVSGTYFISSSVSGSGSGSTTFPYSGSAVITGSLEISSVTSSISISDKITSDKDLEIDVVTDLVFPGALHFEIPSFLYLQPGFTMGSGSFCIDTYLYLTELPDSNGYTLMSPDSPGLVGMRVVLTQDSEVVTDANGGPINSYSFNDEFPLDQWFHLAIVRDDAGRETAYLNGVRAIEGIGGENINYSGLTTLIGEDSSGNNAFNGNISNLRVMQGSYPYDPTQSTIDVPERPIPLDTNTKLLLQVLSPSTFIDDASNTQTVSNTGVTYATPTNGPTEIVKSFIFKQDGSLVFPDSTIQTTAYVSGGLVTSASYAVNAESASWLPIVAGENITINKVSGSYEISGSAGGGSGNTLLSLNLSSGSMNYVGNQYERSVEITYNILGPLGCKSGKFHASIWSGSVNSYDVGLVDLGQELPGLEAINNGGEIIVQIPQYPDDKHELKYYINTF
jgi:hypothetical protein